MAINCCGNCDRCRFSTFTVGLVDWKSHDYSWLSMISITRWGWNCGLWRAECWKHTFLSNMRIRSGKVECIWKWFQHYLSWIRTQLRASECMFWHGYWATTWSQNPIWRQKTGSNYPVTPIIYLTDIYLLLLLLIFNVPSHHWSEFVEKYRSSHVPSLNNNLKNKMVVDGFLQIIAPHMNIFGVAACVFSKRRSYNKSRHG